MHGRRILHVPTAGYQFGEDFNPERVGRLVGNIKECCATNPADCLSAGYAGAMVLKVNMAASPGLQYGPQGIRLGCAIVLRQRPSPQCLGHQSMRLQSPLVFCFDQMEQSNIRRPPSQLYITFKVIQLLNQLRKRLRPRIQSNKPSNDPSTQAFAADLEKAISRGIPRRIAPEAISQNRTSKHRHALRGELTSRDVPQCCAGVTMSLHR
jgi:hypothetical protein